MSHAIGPGGGLREVAIFRHNLFRISEPFITEQRATPAPLPADLRGQNAVRSSSGRSQLSCAGGPLQTVRAAAHRLANDHWKYAPLSAPAGAPASVVDSCAFRYRGRLRAAAGEATRDTARHPRFTGSMRRSRRTRCWDRRPGIAIRCCAGNWRARASCSSVPSSFIRDRLLAMGFPESRTHTHYIGVDCEAIRLRGDFEERPVILHVARLVEVKGTRYLLRAFATVAQRYAGVQLAIIGDGPLKRPASGTRRGSRRTRPRRISGRPAPTPRCLRGCTKPAMLVLPGVRTTTGREEGLGMGAVGSGGHRRAGHRFSSGRDTGMHPRWQDGVPGPGARRWRAG